MQIPSAYKLISREYINEVNSDAMILSHNATGARVAILSNTDDNKVFSIGFRTPPKDSTGVAHIMEHSVLCGSERFPAKDPFVELAKGSLNTFLNAMTYPDKTVYPVASCNDADFQNLIHVYLDAVFHPNIYQHQEIFKQEGWHYEMTSPEDDIIYNGVVYNEMKGAFSSPEQILYRRITDTLYPDTIYSVESGGDPDVIPELTYEQFLEFHRTFYHPSNSYIYLYGDMDVYEKLDFIDREYLRHYTFLDVDSRIDKQKPFVTPSLLRGEYPVGEDDKISNASYMAYSWVIGDSLDPKLYLAFQILEYALMEAPGAPLKQALLDLELGEDIFGNYETSIIQPYLSIIIKNMDESNQQQMVDVINEKLRDLADGQLSKRTLNAALNYFEFKSKEGDFGRWPKGLMYGLQAMDSWLYDETKPFIHLKFKAVYDELRIEVDNGYFENLIRKYLINNTHASVYLLCPSQGMAIRKEEELSNKLARYKESLDDAQINSIISDTLHLKQYQSEPSPKEVMEMIPLLGIDDIKKESEPLVNEMIDLDKLKLLYHDVVTNGIGYVNLLFDISHIPQEEVPYLGVLTEALTDMDTADYSYNELSDEINLNTGGISTQVSIYSIAHDDDFKVVFDVGGKAMYEKLDKLVEIFNEIIIKTDFSDDKRLKEILAQLKSRMEMGFLSAGHSTAVNRASSYFNPASWYKELVEGIAFYEFLCDIIENYDERKDELIKHLGDISSRIFREEFLMVDLTADKKGLEIVKPLIKNLTANLYSNELTEEMRTKKLIGVCNRKGEAFVTAGMIQYNACAGSFRKAGFKYDGSMNVIKNILGNEYLWNNVRVKGGAYGCMCGFAINGSGYFTSYRDPNLENTYEIYEKAADFIRNLELDERELTKYIIGAIGAMDTPLTASMRGARSLAAFMSKRSYEELQATRDELLTATVDTLRAQADAVEAVVNMGYRCVVGSESKIMANKDRFEHIIKLIR